PEAIRLLREGGVLYAPGIAAACGAALLQNTRQESDKRLRTGMKAILDAVWEESLRIPRQELTSAAYIAAFEPIAQTMLAQGI
ncbi:MAG: hypothetical protein LUH42_01780, partial [Oscillospiraceae bacterium]|nr:hypothetical protein [Oscillospiraceae bacterium]